MVTEPRRIAAVSFTHHIAEERGCPPPGTTGSSVRYMVHNNRRGHLPSCQIIYMTIGILLKMLVSDRTAADNDVDNSGSLYGDNDDNNYNDKE